MNFAASRASSADLTSLTNPALPRPPAYTCAFTTHIGELNFSNAAAASSGDRTTSAGGTGMPLSDRIWRAWYSWIFMREVVVLLVKGFATGRKRRAYANCLAWTPPLDRATNHPWPQRP